MSLNEDTPVSLEEVEKALTEIENRFSPNKPNRGNCFEDALTVLSKEFDSLGLSPIDCSQSLCKTFKQVVREAHSLVQIHRRTLLDIKDINIENRYKDSRSTDLYKIIEDYKLQLCRSEEKNSILKGKLIKSTNELTDALKREKTLKEEMERTKRYYIAKHNELQHHLNKVSKENNRLKELFGKDINTHNSKDDVVLKLLKRYKDKEEMYKSAIQKLQDNNTVLLNEILDLKDEHAKALNDIEDKKPKT
ncbi:hypothetical protein NQ315_004160 [Exocentrus adspersus]|uniref:Uncharacterized protein n=1 Tax=Exocentrus adspersus TaxID=1586481 RepID=A0AAV8W6E7_9CUCU|nr:hypothetical protein NQ315_004160 [Exocentrus adspersus]